jgi:hypothetical protein
LQEILQPSQADKYQCEKCINQQRNRELLERNIWEKGSTYGRSLLDQKPMPAKSKYGMESTI